MSLARTQDRRLELPGSLQSQLLEFRRRVWSVKLAEGVLSAAFGVVVAFLVMFALDRVWDTPGWPRAALFVASALAMLTVPWALHRWVWGSRHLEQLAQILTRKHPHVGDQLLGVIELVHDDSEQARSRQLCEAAIVQVAEDARKRDFRDAVPNPRHKLWGWAFAVPAAVTLGLFAFVPAAASNAWARLAAPWRSTPRYTFAAVEPLPGTLVVPHGEPHTLPVALAKGTAWTPRQGEARLGGQPPLVAPLKEGKYAFALPPQIAKGKLDVLVGDSVQHVGIVPTLRPELTSVVADATLPAYLGRPGAERKDVRGGSVALVKGTSVKFAATATRDLASAKVDGAPASPAGPTVTTPALTVDGARTIEIRWKDTLGLEGKEPFALTVNGRDDEAPTLSTEELPRMKVVLDSEQISFKVRAQDDFGVKAVGMEWLGLDDQAVAKPAKGERVLAAGAHDKDSLDVPGTFSAKTLGIDEPQPIQVRVYVEDYLPGRARVYSPPHVLYVLNPEQHAIWVTEQLSKWHRASLEVRDREMQLFEGNKQIRELAKEEIDRPETRRKIEGQAAGERANGRRLSSLVVSGEDLVRQASRNPEIGIGHLEKWAEMLQILKDISGNRMPSVADLLKEAAQSPLAASNSGSQKTARTAGQSTANGGRPRPTEVKPSAPKPAAPSIALGDSSQQPPNKNADQTPAKTSEKQARLTLPQNVLMGPGSSKKPPEQPEQAEQKMEQAIAKQQDLLAEFDKIADELNRVLANLEGSTLVKRLKAASRVQYKVAGRVTEQVGDAFGVSTSRVADGAAKILTEAAEQEAKGSHDVSLIMDDMSAYFERRQFMQFKNVLDDMRKLDVIGSLRQLGDDIKKENGVSIAQCEFWSDTLDRWAEDLVDPACNGTCNAKSKQSLPPSLILEVLQVLEAEINLREETRVTQQAKPALKLPDFASAADKLSGTQLKLRDRTTKVVEAIHDLPDSETEFGYEMNLLTQVAAVMDEAGDILARPETGNPAIAAETEAIELLLKSKRINPKGGGGGGNSPGGGGKGTTNDSALALLGGGVNEKEVREDHGVQQATGETGPVLPEEFRAGLDEYFNRIERRGGNGGGQ